MRRIKRSVTIKYKYVHLYQTYPLKLRSDGNKISTRNVILITLFFYNFGAEAERSYCFWKFEPEMFLRCS